MSASDEREALAHLEVPLYKHALGLLAEHPDGPLPSGERPFPGGKGSAPGSAGRPAEQRRTELATLLREFAEDPAQSPSTLQAHLQTADFAVWMINEAVKSATPALDPTRSRDTGIWLVRHGTSQRAVFCGLAMLAGTALPEDAAPIRTVGLLAGLTEPAVVALSKLDQPTADLIWLADRAPRRRLSTVILALCARDAPAAGAWILEGDGLKGLTLASSQAREIAEAIHLPEMLSRRPADEHALEQVGLLLLNVAASNDYRQQISSYADACAVYELLAELAGGLTPSIARYALLTSLVDELRSGHSRLLAWTPGMRQLALRRLLAILRRPAWRAEVLAAAFSPEPTDRRRADWIQRMGDDAFKETADDTATDSPLPLLPSAAHRLAIHVTVADPAVGNGVETRILVDGRPLVGDAFDRGAPHAPEYLLEARRLRAAPQPRRVQLAEAWCTEGCCGALYVTIVRDGDTVWWRDWERPLGSAGQPPLPALPDVRFEASRYNAEVLRAENDHSWEWPARTVTRLLRERLRAEPDLLNRWECAPGWISTHHNDRDRVDFTFTYPHRAADGPTAPRVQFVWPVPVTDAAPRDQADAIVHRLTTTDPTAHAHAVGGSREAFEALGFSWPPPTDLP